MTELAPAGGIDVLVISDDEPVLQALRTELAPDQANVDGILGTEVMLGLVIDADYPNNRMLMRCPARRPRVCRAARSSTIRPSGRSCSGCIGEDDLGSGSGSGIL